MTMFCNKYHQCLPLLTSEKGTLDMMDNYSVLLLKWYYIL